MEPAGHCLEPAVVVGMLMWPSKQQKPCSRRLIGGEEFEEEEVERPLMTAAKLSIKAVQIYLNQVLAAQEVDR